jgi:hypothetical protein
MTSVGVSANASSFGIASMYSPLAQAVLGNKSPYMPLGGQALTPSQRDDTVYVPPTNGVQNPAWVAGNRIIYPLTKTATLIGKVWHEITLTAGQTAPAYTPAIPVDFVRGTAAVPAVGTPQAEYIKNIGDLICSYVLLRYGTTVLQQYTTDMVVAQRFLRANNINIEATNVEVLGNLAPGGNTELTLIDAFYKGVTLRHPVEEIYFTQALDRHWMPEALALEATLEFTLRDIGNCIITATGLATAIATAPTISNCVLRYQQITLSAAEKMNRLALYKSPDGVVNLFEDCEDQLGFQYTVQQPLNVASAVPATLVVPLSNFRMDSKEIIFYVRCVQNTGTYGVIGPNNYGAFSGNLAKYQGSPFESDRITPSLLFTLNLVNPGNVIGTLLPIFQYKVVANGKDLNNFAPELFNRTLYRKTYHPDAQTGNFIYSIPFALFPEDARNATGHISASTLGNLSLVIQLFPPVIPTNVAGSLVLQVDAHSKCHNIMQHKAGSVAKALN